MLGLMSEEQTIMILGVIFATILALGALGFASIYYEHKNNKK